MSRDEHYSPFGPMPGPRLSQPGEEVWRLVERLIGTVRREYLDSLLFWTAADLERKLVEFQGYYNRHRTHTGRAGRPPSPDTAGAGASLQAYRWQPHCRGLYQTPRAA